MNPWTSSPSRSLDALSSDSSSSSSAFLVAWHVASTLLRRLWDAYVAYLWYYQPNSWVGRVASTFRVLAVILVLPVVLLTLLDVTSYVIARTLGVIDDVKASTSDAETTTTPDGQKIAVAVAAQAPARAPTASSLSHDIGAPVRASEGLATEDFVEGQTDGDGNGRGCVSETAVGTSAPVSTIHDHAHAGTLIQTQTQMRLRSADQEASDTPSHAYYFAGEEDLRLAGEGVFSPAVSMPPSPLTPRMPLHTFTESDGREVGQVSEEDIVLRRRVQGAREDELGHA